MNKLEEFKIFIKNNPTFATYIKDNSMTWQKFYELYDMYGEDSPIWDEYKQEKKSIPTISELVSLAKNIDMDKLQEGVNSLSKAVGLFSDLFTNKKTNINNSYKPRAIYKRFED